MSRYRPKKKKKKFVPEGEPEIKLAFEVRTKNGQPKLSIKYLDTDYIESRKDSKRIQVVDVESCVVRDFDGYRLYTFLGSLDLKVVRKSIMPFLNAIFWMGVKAGRNMQQGGESC